MNPKHFFVVPELIAASYFGPSGTRAAAQSQSVLPQGTFEQPGINGKPSGWSIQTPEGTTLAGDAKNHWVQLRDGAVMMHFLKLSPEWNKLVISARFISGSTRARPCGPRPRRIPRETVSSISSSISSLPSRDMCGWSYE